MNGIPKKTTWRRSLIAALKVGAAGAALFFVGKIFADNWADFRAGWRPPAAAWLIAAAAALVASYVALFRISLAVLGRLGWRLKWRSGLRPFFYSLLGRYIPGRVAVILGKVYFYERRGIPRVTAVLAPAYENIFAAVGGCVASLACAAELWGDRLSWWQLGPVIGAVAVLVALIQPPVLKRLLGFVLKMMEKGAPPPAIIGPGGAATFAAAYAGYCVLLGIFFAGFARAFVPLSAAGTAAAGAAFVAASFLGYAAVIFPSGLGVREGLLLAMLWPFMKPGDAAFLAVASRVVAVAAELLWAAGAAFAGTEEKAEPR